MLSRLMTPREQFVLAFLALSLCVGAGTMYMNRAPVEPEAITAIVPVAEPVPVAPEVQPELTELVVRLEPEKLEAPVINPTVSVTGEVEAPGVYQLPAGARVRDLIDEAGGATNFADLSDINLAAKLIDQTTLTIPSSARITREDTMVTIEHRASPVDNPAQYTISGWQASVQNEPTTEATPAITTRRSTSPSKLNIRTATAAQLETLPGIGPVLADAIVRHRAEHPFNSIEDLEDVSGIGPKRLDAIRELVTVH